MHILNFEQGGFCDVNGEIEVRWLGIRAVKFDEFAENHVLFVCPDRLVVVRTLVRETVVDGSALVDHAGLIEPGQTQFCLVPIHFCHIFIVEIIISAFQVRGSTEEEFVGNGVDVVFLRRPICAAVGTGVPHVRATASNIDEQGRDTQGDWLISAL
jgi:hypothetical protein